MAPARRVGVLSRAAVGLAVRSLPELDDRLRYRAEFTADLVTLPVLGRLRYSAGVLSQTFALRAALGSARTRVEEAAMTTPTRPRVLFLRCRVFRVHRWVTRSTEDGDRYVACARCGRLKTEFEPRWPDPGDEEDPLARYRGIGGLGGLG